MVEEDPTGVATGGNSSLGSNWEVFIHFFFSHALVVKEWLMVGPGYIITSSLLFIIIFGSAYVGTGRTGRIVLNR